MLAALRPISRQTARVAGRCYSTNVSVIGAPISLGQPRGGVESGPQDLRNAGLLEGIQGLGLNVNDRGDLSFDTRAAEDRPVPEELGLCHNNVRLGLAQEKIASETAAAAAAGDFVLTLGGDHGIAHGTISGILRERPNLGVIWVDAHADINTPRISPSGNFHGMPVGFLMQLHRSTEVPGFEWTSSVPVLRPDRIVYVGLRDVDHGEKELLRELGVRAFSLHDVDKYGISTIMEMTMDWLGTNPLHLSYDIDAVDPMYAPGTGTPSHGGLTLREGHFIAEEMAKTGRLGSMDMVEVNAHLADHSSAQRTIALGKELVLSALGKTIL